MLSVTYLSMSRPENSWSSILGILNGTGESPTFFNTIMMHTNPPPELMVRKLRREYKAAFSLADVRACTTVVRVCTAIRRVPLMVFGLKVEDSVLTVTKVVMARPHAGMHRKFKVLVRGVLDACADKMGIYTYTINVPTGRNTVLADVLMENDFIKCEGSDVFTRRFSASQVSTPNSNVTLPVETFTPARSPLVDVVE